VTAFLSDIRWNAGSRNATRRLFSARIVLEKTERSSWLLALSSLSQRQDGGSAIYVLEIRAIAEV
jgi:hypothetical protein